MTKWIPNLSQNLKLVMCLYRTPTALVDGEQYQLFRICIQTFKEPGIEPSRNVNLSVTHFQIT